MSRQLQAKFIGRANKMKEYIKVVARPKSQIHGVGKQNERPITVIAHPELRQFSRLMHRARRTHAPFPPPSHPVGNDCAKTLGGKSNSECKYGNGGCVGLKPTSLLIYSVCNKGFAPLCAFQTAAILIPLYIITYFFRERKRADRKK